MDIINYGGQEVPKYISQGHHSKYIIPIAQEFCQGLGLDIGCGKVEWAFPGAMPIDLKIGKTYDAYNLPDDKWDYIFSSHCLEHLPNYVEALTYWTQKLKSKGILFLYLPHPDCVYWRPWNKKNDKHLHQFYPEQIVEILETLGYNNIFYSERDLAYSFAIVGEKQ